MTTRRELIAAAALLSMKRAGGIGWCLAIAACGRLGFSPVGDGATGDGSAARGFCATRTPAPTFCEDFDEGLGTQQWPSTMMFNGAFAIDAIAGRSSPASLVVTSNALATTSDQVGVQLVTAPLGNATQHVTATMAVRLDDYGGSGGVLLELVADDGTTAHVLELVYDVTAQLEDGTGPSGQNSTSYQTHDLPAISAGTWHDWVIDLATGASSAVTIQLDGTSALTFTPLSANGGQVTLYIGMPYMTGPAMPWKLHLDDVAVTIQ